MPFEIVGRERDLASVQAFVGREAGGLFGVTPSDLRVTRLPGERDLHAAIGLARSLFMAPPADGAAVQAADAALERLGALLLGGHLDLIAHARVIIVAPDGVLHQVPWQALRGRVGREPLSATHHVSIVPSATFLAGVRTGDASGGRGDMLVACVSANRSDGPRLSGAAREASWIRDSFQDVSIHFPGRRGGDSLQSEDLAPFEVLHFAGHVRADDERPWLSGFTNAWSANPDQRRILTAGDIAASRLEARLAVLSGCESAGGRVHPGEGVAGLTSAFLAAGVPTVVATLWPVDDRTTRRIMERFYTALAAGDDAATALARGTNAIRRNPRTAHPFYWAGYVLVGEAGTRVPLRRRTVSPGRVLPWVVGLAMGLTALAGWRGWRRAV